MTQATRRTRKTASRVACAKVLAAAGAAAALPAVCAANPIAPQFGGNWDANANVGSSYTSQSALVNINTGVTVNVLAETTIAVTGTMNWYDGSTTAGILNNYGTLNFTGFNGRFVQSGTPTINNFGAFNFGDLTDPRCYGAFTFYNGGTIAKTAGTGATTLFTQTAGTMNNYYDAGGGNITGGTIRVDTGTLAIGGQAWNFKGNQTITVATGATFSAGDTTTHVFGGTWNGTGGGVVSWVGGDNTVIDAAGFTLNIDDGNRSSYTTGGVKLGAGKTFRSSSGGTVLNKGKFHFDLTARWQGPLNLHNEGWLVWDDTTNTMNLQYATAGSELRNKNGGVIDVLKGTRTGSGHPITVTLQSGSTFRGKAASGTASWSAGIGRFNIDNGSSIEVVSNELEINPGAGATTIYFGGSNTAMSTLNFNATVNNGATLDIRNIAAGGITAVGAGSTLHMKGTGQFLNNATNVLQSKLATVNGTLLVSDSFSLTPGGGTLSVGATGTLGGGGGTISGAVTVASGGTVSPGTSVGTLNVTGNVDFAANSILSVELQGTTADLLNISGATMVDVDGLDIVLSGGPTLFEYKVIESNVAISGNVDSVTGLSGWSAQKREGDTELWVVVPEPGSASLLGAMASASLLGRRRRGRAGAR